MKISRNFNWLIIVLLFMTAFICRSVIGVVALWVYIFYSAARSEDIKNNRIFFIRVIFLCLILGIHTCIFIGQREYSRVHITKEDIKSTVNTVQEQTDNIVLRVIAEWAAGDRDINENIVAYSKYIVPARNNEYVEVPRECISSVQYLKSIEELQYKYLHSGEFLDISKGSLSTRLSEEDKELYSDILVYTIFIWFMNECVAAVLCILAAYLFFSGKNESIDIEVSEYNPEVLSDIAFERLFGGIKKDEL